MHKLWTDCTALICQLKKLEGHEEVSGHLVHNSFFFVFFVVFINVRSSVHVDLKWRRTAASVLSASIADLLRSEKGNVWHNFLPLMSKRTRSMLITANYAKFRLIIGESGDDSLDNRRQY